MSACVAAGTLPPPDTVSDAIETASVCVSLVSWSVKLIVPVGGVLLSSDAEPVVSAC